VTRASRGVARRAAAAVALTTVALLLAACSVTTSDKPAVTPFNPLDPDGSASKAGTGTAAPTGPDLQLRPVLSVERAGDDRCPPQPEPTTPPAAEPATLCTADLAWVVGLAPAVVSGQRVKAVDAGTLSGGPTVRITLDVTGATALANATLTMSQQQSPANMLAVVSHGRVQSAPEVHDQISGGVLDLTGFADVEAARAAAAVFGD
jgi:hypothetical protein